MFRGDEVVRASLHLGLVDGGEAGSGGSVGGEESGAEVGGGGEVPVAVHVLAQ